MNELRKIDLPGPVNAFPDEPEAERGRKRDRWNEIRGQRHPAIRRDLLVFGPSPTSALPSTV